MYRLLPLLVLFFSQPHWSGVRLIRDSHVESLRRPMEVKGWDSWGLVLKGGSGYVPLDLERPLRIDSAFLREATRRGVELGADGRVYGLVRIYHWCGNDPMGLEIVRLDVADVLRFFDSGGFLCRDHPAVDRCQNYQGMMSGRGWLVGEYRLYREWTRESVLHAR